MVKKKQRFSKRSLAALVLSTAAIGTSIFLSFGKGKPIAVPAYTATRVFDGDTFETKEKQYIRLSGINAPEIGQCGSEEATKQLEKLILGKKLYIKILYHIGSRMMGLVYTDSGLVNEHMLSSGWAELNDRDSVNIPTLQKATKVAREKSLGVFGSLCTQTSNTKNPRCTIKANVTSNNKPTYHLPGCQTYTTTKVQLHHGDRWFCREKEAKAAGFMKASTCPP